MKKILPILKGVLLATLFVLSNAGCNDELNLVEGSKDIPVIYGFLSLNDTATYIRVEKAFIDPVRGAAEIAKIADSLYYKNISVTLIRVSNNEKFTLQRVDGNTEGYVRDAGIFATLPNILYKIKNANLQMKADEAFRIEIQRTGETKLLAKATTRVIGAYNIFAPPPTVALFLTYENTLSISIETEEKTAKFYDIKVIVNFDEVSGTTRTPRRAEWLLAGGQPRKGTDVQTFFRRNARDFYVFLGTTLTPNPSFAREFKSIDFEVTAAGQELVDFQSVGVANIGITGSQAIPTYTNIEGGLGIFTSRSKAVLKGIKLNDQALEILKTGELTRNLGFR